MTLLIIKIQQNQPSDITLKKKISNKGGTSSKFNDHHLRFNVCEDCLATVMVLPLHYVMIFFISEAFVYKSSVKF